MSLSEIYQGFCKISICKSKILAQFLNHIKEVEKVLNSMPQQYYDHQQYDDIYRYDILKEKAIEQSECIIEFERLKGEEMELKNILQKRKQEKNRLQMQQKKLKKIGVGLEILNFGHISSRPSTKRSIKQVSHTSPRSKTLQKQKLQLQLLRIQEQNKEKQSELRSLNIQQTQKIQANKKVYQKYQNIHREIQQRKENNLTLQRQLEAKTKEYQQAEKENEKYRKYLNKFSKERPSGENLQGKIEGLSNIHRKLKNNYEKTLKIHKKLLSTLESERSKYSNCQ